MSKSKRYETLLATLDGSKINDGTKGYISVKVELHELGACIKVSPEKRRGLLQVLHSTRALDSGLRLALRHTGAIPSYSIGKYLEQLCAAGRITKSAEMHYKKTVADVRNRYLHKANAFPSSSKEVDSLVAEIGECLSQVLAKL